MKIPVAILGSTGAVGQKFISLLESHPLFEVAEVCASLKNIGKTYGKAVDWREKKKLSPSIAQLKIKDHKNLSSPIILSSLPSEIAIDWEPFLAEKGHHIVSNASALRMSTDVPLIIPEINSHDISFIKNQSTKGKIITNPNCATVFFALGLHPLLKMGDISNVSVFTLQALSGAGYPGVASWDILSNIIPNIGGEEEKLETEVHKIFKNCLGYNDFDVTANVSRVPVVHGHTIILHARFKDEIKVSEVDKRFLELSQEMPQLYKYYTDLYSPQPLKHLDDNDYRAHIGRVKQGGDKKTISITSMGHNLVRGAAGAALLNLELLAKETLNLENKLT